MENPGGSTDSRISSSSDGKVGGCSEGWTLCMKGREVAQQIFGTKLWNSSEGKQSPNDWGMEAFYREAKAGPSNSTFP